MNASRHMDYEGMIKRYLQEHRPVITAADLESVSACDRTCIEHYMQDLGDNAIGIISGSSQLSVILDVHYDVGAHANVLGKELRLLADRYPDAIFHSRPPGGLSRAWVILPWWTADAGSFPGNPSEQVPREAAFSACDLRQKLGCAQHFATTVGDKVARPDKAPRAGLIFINAENGERPHL